MKGLEQKNISAKVLDSERKKAGEYSGRLSVKFLAATFGNVDSYRDTILKGAFVKGTDQEDWDRVAFCKQHDMREPIGKIIELKETDEGLYCEVIISASEEDIAIKIEEGILKEFSIGYVSKKSTYIEEPAEGEADRILEEIKLFEISVVTRAADPNAIVVDTERKSEEEQVKELEAKSDKELKELKAKIEDIEAKRILEKLFE